MNDELPVQSPAPGARERGTVLIVDDHPGNLGFLFDHLERSGYRVLVAMCGQEALEQLEHVLPDAILLDVMMPDLDGFAICARLKERERTRELPVIFMSALSEPRDKVRAFSVGAVDYVTKPVNKEEVLARVDAHVSLRRLRRELEERNRQLEERSRQLEERNEELAAFSRMVAHDLRGSLTRILGHVELILDQDPAALDPDLLADLQRIRESTFGMAEVIESLLLLAGISRQKVQLEPISMAEIIPRALRSLEDSIAAHGAEIRAPDEWPMVVGYAPWVERVWFNYVSNGLKYGGSPPRLELGAEAGPDGMIRFWIRDNGPGLSDAARLGVFKPFTRFHRDRFDGHGLGLSIVQRIVKKLRGEVGVRVPAGGGSEFYFTLPRA